MTYDDYVEDTANIIASLYPNAKNPQDQAEKAVKKAVLASYAASNWAFKRRQEDVGVTASANYYDLPADFEGFESVVERTTTNGAQLEYMPKSEFDRYFPYPASHSVGTPRVFTI